MLDRTEWLKQRRTGIGGSDIAAVLGLSPWRTPLQVWLEKTGRAPDIDEPTEAMYWGTELEDLVAREYAKRTGLGVQRVNAIVRHPESPCLIGSIDRAVFVPGTKPVVRGEFRTDRILECKTASAYAGSAWGEPGSADFPVYYAAQCMHYLCVTGCQRCDLAVLLGGREYRQYAVERDEATIAKMRAAAEKFWCDNVAADVAPAPNDTADVLTLFPRSAEKRVRATPAVEAAAMAMARLGLEIEEKEKAWTTLKDALCVALCDGDTLEAPDGARVLATWKSAKDSRKTDWEKVARQCGAAPELIEAHTRLVAGSRRFLLKVDTEQGKED